MKLPVLKSHPLEEPIRTGEGKFADPCSQCSLNGVCVADGCHGECVQQACYMDCNNCGGQRDYDGSLTVLNVPSVCCKAPLRDIQLDLVRKERYDFTQRDPIELKTKSVVVTQGSAGRASATLRPR